MSTRATEIESEVCTWPGIVSESRRFECREFSLGAREIGRLHGGARVEVPFAKRVRDALVQSGSVRIHDRYPTSGWIAFDIEDEADVDRAIDLFRLSYLHEVGVLQRRGTDTRELSLLDVGRELEDVELPERARGAVAEAVSVERPDDVRVTETEVRARTETGADTDADRPDERYRSRLEAPPADDPDADST